VVLFHELTHWSGVAHRLNREGITKAIRFGNEEEESLRGPSETVRLSAARAFRRQGNVRKGGCWSEASREKRRE